MDRFSQMSDCGHQGCHIISRGWEEYFIGEGNGNTYGKKKERKMESLVDIKKRRSSHLGGADCF